MRLSTMKRHALTALLMLLFAVHYVPATATLRNWTGDLPLEQFSDEDRSLFRASIKDALEHKADGATLDWKNPDTKSSGSITPISTFEDSGMTCRKARIVNRVGESVNESVFVFCRVSDGSWKIAR